MLQAYQTTFIPISLSLLPLLVMAWAFWVRYLANELSKQTNTAKILNELITSETILKNNEVK